MNIEVCLMKIKNIYHIVYIFSFGMLTILASPVAFLASRRLWSCVHSVFWHEAHCGVTWI